MLQEGIDQSRSELLQSNGKSSTVNYRISLQDSKPIPNGSSTGALVQVTNRREETLKNSSTRPSNNNLIAYFTQSKDGSDR